MGGSRSSRRVVVSALLVTSCVFGGGTSFALNGHELHGLGSVNSSMGGAGTGIFLDPIGMLAWNPAGSVQFEDATLGLSMEALFVDVSLQSSAVADAFGPGAPAFATLGSTDTIAKMPILPAFAMTRPFGNGDRAWHVGVLAVAGFGATYPVDELDGPDANIILTDALGFGSIESEYALIKVPLGMSFQTTEKLSLGFSLVPAFAQLNAKPLVVATPDDADGDGVPTYPRLHNEERGFGFGVQVGLYYQATERLGIGFSIASPIWTEDFEFLPEDELGAPRDEVSFGFDGPGFVSFGLGYEIRPGTHLAADVRYFDFAGTEGFDEEGLRADGSLAGLGWDGSLVIGLGFSHELGDWGSLRVGYNYGENPIPERLTFYNSLSPLVTEHTVSLGMTVHLSESTDLDFGYYHSFENDIAGPYLAGGVAVPGTEVRPSLSIDAVSVGLRMRF